MNPITGIPYGLAVSGKYVYASDYNNSAVRIVDVSDPTAPTLAGSVSISSSNPYGVFVAGKYLYVADGSNMKIHVLQRDTLEELTTFGDGGRQPGQFYAVHSIAADSKGQVFVAWHAGGPGSKGEGDRRVWLTSSTDEGLTFSRERAISNVYFGPRGSV